MPNGGRGNRNMYYLTGLPGWMRFGYSPAWRGRSPTGLGPCATYMMTGQWPTPQAQAYWQAMGAGQAAPTTAPGVTPVTPQMTEKQELDFLKDQAQAVREQLEQIEARMRELETKEK